MKTPQIFCIAKNRWDEVHSLPQGNDWWGGRVGKRSRKVRDMYKADMGLNRVIRVANDYSQRHMNNEA